MHFGFFGSFESWQAGLAFLLLLCNYAWCAATIVMIGDSTMAPDYGNVLGWGQKLQDALKAQGVTATVVNKAVPGSTAKSWTEQGLFKQAASLVNSGTFVFIELGT